MCWEFYEVVNTKKHTSNNSIMGHLCTDMKVSPLHNLIKKQCLITITSPFFVVIGYAHEWILESTLLVSMLLKNQIIFSYLFCTSYFIWNCFCNYFGFSSLSEIITNCLMSYFLISLFFGFGVIDYVLRILWSCQH